MTADCNLLSRPADGPGMAGVQGEQGANSDHLGAIEAVTSRSVKGLRIEVCVTGPPCRIASSAVSDRGLFFAHSKYEASWDRLRRVQGDYFSPVFANRRD